MVVNAPTSNIVSAAELAVALMLAAARHVSPGARRAASNGEWKRSQYTGIELYEKTVGIVGLGRIGVLVAQRLCGVRHEGHRLRPLRAGRPRRADGRPPGRPRHPARRVRLHVACTCPRPPRPSGLIGAERAAQGQAARWCWSTPPAAASSTRPRCTPPSRRAGSPPPGSTSSPRSRAPTARCSSSRTSSPPRTSAPPPTRPRRRPASPSRARCASRCPASWSPTPSTSRAA